MKIFTVIAVVCYLFVTTNSLPTVPASHPASDTIKKCSDEYHVTLDDAKKLVIHRKQASNENEKCYLSCYLKSRGYLVDHKINWELLYDTHAARVTDESQKEEMKKIFKKCEENFSYTDKDDCQIAYDAYKCA